MALKELDIDKNWFRGTTVREINWDNINDPLLEWAEFMVKDVDQMRLDVFGSTYSFDNDGLANLPNPLYNPTTKTSAIDWTFSGDVVFSANDLKIYGGNDLILYKDTGVTIGVQIDGGSPTTTNVIDVPTADALTTGGILNLASDSADTGTRSLVKIVNDNTLATGATLLEVVQDAAQRAVFIDQNGDAASLSIDSEATTANVINITDPATTTGNILDVANPANTTGHIINIDQADALTTASILNLISDSADTGTRTLVQVTNDNTLATGATVLGLQQDSTGDALFVDVNGNATGINVDDDGTGDSVVVDKGSTGDALRIVSADNVLNVTNAADDESYFLLDGTGKIKHAGAVAPGWFCNLGLELDSGQLKIVGADGTDLSATNPAWIALKGDTDGQVQVVKVDTATNLFDDASTVSSDIAGEEFGTDASDEWAPDRAFMLYFAKGGSNNFFFISPSPILTETPSLAANIGYQGTPMSTPSDNGIFALTSTDVTGENNVPCVRIGSFRMTKDITDDWTVTALDDKDGINKFFNFGQRLYDMENTQMGAATDYMKDNGGQAPEFSTESYKYTVTMDGMVKAWVRLGGDGGNDGNTAVTALMATPYNHNLDADSIVGDGLINTPSYANNHVLMLTQSTNSTSVYFFRTSANAVVQNSDFTSGNRTIAVSFEIKCFS